MTKQMYRFQQEGVDYMVHRPASLNADDPGTGKTIQVCGVVNQNRPKSGLIACPSFLALNWKKELDEWCPGIESRVVTSDTKSVARGTGHGITIVGYELLRNMAPWFSQFHFDMMVADEGHYLMNRLSKRSKAVAMQKAKQKIVLSGTPIQSRPINLWNILHWLNPGYKEWSDYWYYGLKYCNGHQSSWGWDLSGASNMEELNGILRKMLMIRRTKTEVLPQLPPKIRQIIELPCASYRELIEQEKQMFYDWQSELAGKPIRDLNDTFGEEYQDELFGMRGNNLYSMREISKLRKKTGLLKLPMAVEHIRNLLHHQQKVVVFAHHHDVLDQLRDHFDTALWTDGRHQADDRYRICMRFQGDPEQRLLIAGLTAVTEGVTLTSADVACYVELDWTPRVMLQTEDRFHRIGLDHSILIQHLVLEGSLDMDIATSLVTKQTVINQIIK